MVVNNPIYRKGDNVLVRVNPILDRRFEWLSAEVEKYSGFLDMYDGRVKQKDVSFPVKQHMYSLRVDGASIPSFEQNILPDPSFHINARTLEALRKYMNRFFNSKLLANRPVSETWK